MKETGQHTKYWRNSEDFTLPHRFLVIPPGIHVDSWSPPGVQVEFIWQGAQPPAPPQLDNDDNENDEDDENEGRGRVEHEKGAQMTRLASSGP